MSNVDRIVQILREHHFVTELQLDGTRLYHCEKCCGTKVCLAHSIEEYRAHLAAVIDAELHPVIDTVEQLDALPEGAVIRTDEGRVAVKSGYSWGNASGYASWWSTADEEEFDCQSDELDDLPATVLYTPDDAK